MKSNAGGRIRNKELLMQRISFDGLGGQTLYPTDIDMIYEHKNRGYFMAELKRKGSALPTGQRLLMERFARDMQRAGRACGLSGDETEQKANDALTVILENIAELAVAYLIDDRQSVKSEEVAEAIERLEKWRASKYAWTVASAPCGKNIDLAITALQAYQPTTRKDTNNTGG